MARKSPLIWSIAVLAAAGAMAGGVLYLGGRTTPQAARMPAPATHPAMALEAKYAGPLGDTMVQRWRDPKYGVVCYVYLPMIVRHEPVTDGSVRYGSRSIGTIRCVPPGKGG